MNAVRLEPERRALRLVLGWLQHQGATFTTIAWDRGKVIAFDLEAYGPVHEVEEINRWVLPQRLARWRLGALARRLRNRRVRRWWRSAGPVDLVLALGPLRDELRHYVPPGRPAAVALVGWRDLEDPESWAATGAAVDHVLAADEETARVARASGVADEAVVDLGGQEERIPRPTAAWARTDREHLSDRIGIRPGTPLVVGLGPTDWRGAPDLLLRAFARLQEKPSAADLHLAWLGGDPESADAYPYHFDVARLGLADRVHWLGDPDDHLALLRRADVVALVGRSEVSIPNERRAPEFHETAALISWLGVPVVAFDVPALGPLANDWTTMVRYPDTDALAEALAAAVDEATTRTRLEATLPLGERLRVVAPRIFTGGPA